MTVLLPRRGLHRQGEPRPGADPEVVQFISISAAFHSVKKQPLRLFKFDPLTSRLQLLPDGREGSEVQAAVQGAA